MTGLSSSARAEGDDLYRSKARANQAPGSVDPAATLQLLRRRFWPLVALVAFGACFSVVVSLGMKPVFTSTAEVELYPAAHRGSEATSLARWSPGDDEVVNTAVAIMRLRAIAAAVVDKLNLAHNPDFFTPKAGFLGLMSGSPKTSLTDEGRRENAIDALRKKIAIRRQNGTYLVSVVARSYDPVEAARMANIYASEYLQESLAFQPDGAGHSANLLNQTVSAKRIQPSIAAQAFATIGSGDQTPTDRQIVQLTSQLAASACDAAHANLTAAQGDATRLLCEELSQLSQMRSQGRGPQSTPGRLIEPARPGNGPSYPDRKLFALVGGLAGLVVGAAVSLTIEMLDTTIRTVADVRSTLGADLIASIPRLTSRQLSGPPPTQALATAMTKTLDAQAPDADHSPAERGGEKRPEMSPADFLLAKPMSTFAESLRDVRSSLMHLRQNISTFDRSFSPEGRIIAITSALPNEGKTTFAASLARIMGMSGERVLLIDCDLRRRALQELFETPFEHGLQDVLAGKIAFQDAMRQDKVQGLDVLVETQTAFNVVDTLGSESMRKLLADLRRRYDYIVIDTPPALALVDARTMCALADGVLMVVRWRYTPRKAAQAALARIEADGAHLLGVVLNRVDPGHSAALS